MEILRYILMGIFVLVCIAATVLVLLQEGRSQGLGAIAGAADQDSDGCILRSGSYPESEYFLILK